MRFLREYFASWKASANGRADTPNRNRYDMNRAVMTRN